MYLHILKPFINCEVFTKVGTEEVEIIAILDYPNIPRVTSDWLYHTSFLKNCHLTFFLYKSETESDEYLDISLRKVKERP